MTDTVQLKLYEVTWGDAWASHQYYNKDHDYAPMRTRDIGYLVEDNDETLVLCRSYTPDAPGAERNLVSIPHVNIISIEELT